MSSPNFQTTKRRQLLARLQDLGRRISAETVFLHQAIAQSVGLNATDTKCIDLILFHPRDSVTAGALSAMTGLTTGAITHILDRLEKKRFVERIRDSQDQRKVFIRVRPASLKPLSPKYEEVREAYMSLAEPYDDKELQLICDYMERASEVSKCELAKILTASGSRSSQAIRRRPPRGRD